MEQRLTEATIQSFLDDLSSSSPTPGGGAVAALTGAMAAGLVAMVCNLTIGRPKYIDVEPAMRSILDHAEAIRRDLTRLIEEDAVAYSRVAEAYRLPRASSAERSTRADAIQLALAGAVAPPLEALGRCRDVLPLALQVAAHGNVNVVSDAGVAAELAVAGVRSSVVNIRVNLAELKDESLSRQAEAAISGSEAGLVDDLHRVEAVVRAKLTPKVKT